MCFQHAILNDKGGILSSRKAVNEIPGGENITTSESIFLASAWMEAQSVLSSSTSSFSWPARGRLRMDMMSCRGPQANAAVPYALRTLKYGLSSIFGIENEGGVSKE